MRFNDNKVMKDLIRLLSDQGPPGVDGEGIT